MTTESDSDKKIEEAMKKFPLERFDFERDTKKAMNACSFAIVGSSKSGKTTFLKHLLSKYFDDDIKVFMTQSPQAEIYNTIKKKCAFAPAYIPDIIKTCYLINKHTKNHYPFCVVVDDVVGVKNDRQMTKLMCLYRNSRMSAVVCGQDAKMLNPTGRANVNNICLFKQNTDNRIEDNIKDFLRTYFPKSLSMDEKIELYKKLTEDHAFLWVDNLNNTIKRCKLTEGQIVE
jgi:GTPase SAR1 family protein